jgi:hypothetical protein
MAWHFPGRFERCRHDQEGQSIPVRELKRGFKKKKKYAVAKWENKHGDQPRKYWHLLGPHQRLRCSLEQVVVTAGDVGTGASHIGGLVGSGLAGIKIGLQGARPRREPWPRIVRPFKTAGSAWRDCFVVSW